MTESERTHNDLQDTKQKAKYWATRRPAKPGVSIQMRVALELIMENPSVLIKTLLNNLKAKEVNLV
jgi:hypothetical protein